MFLEWWMIGVMFVWWLVSIWDIRRTSFEEGAETAVQGLMDGGYIYVDDNDEVIGLCNAHKQRDKRPVEDAVS